MRSFLAKMSGGTGFADRAGWWFSSCPEPLRRFKTRLCRRIKPLSQITRIQTECAANDYKCVGKPNWQPFEDHSFHSRWFEGLLTWPWGWFAIPDPESSPEF